MSYTLYHAKGCGSVAVQVALRVLDVRHLLVELDYDETAARTNKDTPEFQAFTTANPLGPLHQTSFGDVDLCITAQFPTLVTPDGTVLTEIAACLMCESPCTHPESESDSSSHLLLPHAVLVEQHGAGTPWALGNLTSSQLASFYRWMIFIPGNIYPLITLMGRRDRPAPLHLSNN